MKFGVGDGLKFHGLNMVQGH